MRTIVMYILILVYAIPALISKTIGIYRFGKHSWQDMMFMNTWTGISIWIGIGIWMIYPFIARIYQHYTVNSYIRKISNT